MDRMEIPTGITTRPLELGDVADVTALIAAQELDDVGEVVIEEADLVGEWGRPSYDLAASSIGLFDGGRLVAYAEVMAKGRGDAAVHPDYRGRGHRHRARPLDAGQGPGEGFGRGRHAGAAGLAG